ncbi:dihydroorotase [Salinarchaeum sp. IM2453]|uniref:dihydroorotase n=1 Tax=Salinarchaeum sp. IM2453 TaxID=2862870 RepID=UPI001C83A03D|nr:dihydroorotase [Salinarchaeum sp. IM2453]QZA87598.1 dihydroorotase [Salinarchaeum sp. IM2453]
MLLTNAVLPDGQTADIRISGSTIDAVSPSLSPNDDERVFELSGTRVFPGAIDAHVHFREPGFTHKETWATGSKAAAAGGVTTVIDQPNTEPPTVTGRAVEEKLTLARTSLVNYGVNGGVTKQWDPDSLFTSPITALGEVFLADSTGDMGIDTELFETALGYASDANLPVTVHAEDASLFLDDVLSDSKGTGRDATADLWSQYRAAEAEITAVEDALASGERFDADIHVAHTSTPEAIDLVDKHIATCEVTPHHALLSRDDLSDLGTYGRMNPPLRSQDRQQAVLERIIDGKVDIIATDHAPHTQSEKNTSIVDAPSGVPGVETMVPLFLKLAEDGTLSYSRIRDLVARNPAEIFGLESKGSIEPGMDADLFVFDPDDITSISSDHLHGRCSWTPFEDHEAIFPVLTLVNGQIAYLDGTASVFNELSIDNDLFGDELGTNIASQ